MVDAAFEDKEADLVGLITGGVPGMGEVPRVSVFGRGQGRVFGGLGSSIAPLRLAALALQMRIITLELDLRGGLEYVADQGVAWKAESRDRCCEQCQWLWCWGGGGRLEYVR